MNVKRSNFLEKICDSFHFKNCAFLLKNVLDFLIVVYSTINILCITNVTEYKMKKLFGKKDKSEGNSEKTGV